MAEAAYKNYIVKYEIQANVTEAQKGLNNLERSVRSWGATMSRFQKNMSDSATHASNTLKSLQGILTIKPTAQVEPFKEKLTTLLADVRPISDELKAALNITPKINFQNIRNQLKGAVRLASAGNKEIQKTLVENSRQVVKDANSNKGAVGKGKEKGLAISIPIVPDTKLFEEQLRGFAPKTPITVKVRLDTAGLKTDLKNIPGYTLPAKMANQSWMPAGANGGKSKNQAGKNENQAAKGNTTTITRQGTRNEPVKYTTADDRRRNMLLRSANLTASQQKTLENLNNMRLLSGLPQDMADSKVQEALAIQGKINGINTSGAPLTSGKKSYLTRLNNQLKALGWKSNISSVTPLASPVPQVQSYVAPNQPGSVTNPLLAYNGRGVTMRLLLDPDPALATLNNFIAQVRSTVATMQLNATTASATPIIPPYAPGFVPSGAGNSSNQNVSASGTNSNQNTGNKGGTTSRQSSKSVSFPSGFVGSGKNRIFFGNERPSDALAPQGYHWRRATDLVSRLTPSQANSYSEALKNMQTQRESWVNAKNSTATTLSRYGRMQGIQRDISDALNRSAERQNLARIQMMQNQPMIDRLNRQMESLNQQRQTFANLPRLNRNQQQALDRIDAARQQTQQQINTLATPQRIIEQETRNQAALNSRLNAINNSVAKLRPDYQQAKTQRADAKAAYKESREQVGKYTNGWKMAENNPKPSRTRTRQQTEAQRKALTRLQTMRSNAVAPYVTNASQMNLASAFLPQFNGAMNAMNLTPSADLWNNSAYLKEVQRRIIAANQKVPSYLPTAIHKAEQAEAKAAALPRIRGGAGYASEPQSFYTRFRKWGYPFTGNTSFGARTPMAVEMAKGMGVMFAIGGAMSTLTNSFSQAMDYQNTMRTTQAILKNGSDTYTDKGFKSMEAMVRSVGVKTKFSAPEVANAAKFLAMAGFDIAGITATIKPIADLALMGDYDLGETADKMTNIMTTFGVTAEALKDNPNIMREMGNVLAAVSTRSNTDVMMLAESAKYGGGVAKMYGGDDPNIFADTMALFGVMGNAGIQGSSAGTALRMMYQNIFNPNGKQAQLLKDLEEKGVKRFTADRKRRSMSDIILDMAKLPKEMQTDIISKLFRITAQPGANAAINAAYIGHNKDTLAALAKEEGTNLDEAADALNAITKNMDEQGLSALAALMIAAREAAGGNLLENVAGEKQKTIAGLWAQVTSTFTEGIVKAFEEKQGGFEGMLSNLRDYLAKPETVQMMKNLINLVESVLKVMAQFAAIWANIYSFAPGLIKLWVTTQLFFTQLGSLLSPFIGLAGAMNRLGISVLRLSNISTMAGSKMGLISGATAAGYGGLAAANMTDPFIIGSNSLGIQQTISGKAAARARNMVYAGMKSGMTEEQALLATQSHYTEVQNRYARRYNNNWARVGRSYLSGVRTITGLSVTNMFSGFKTGFFNLMGGLANALGLLINPVTITIGALTALGFGIYNLYKRVNGTTEAQIEAQKRVAEIGNAAIAQSIKDGEWYYKLTEEKFNLKPIHFNPFEQDDDVKKYKEKQEDNKARYGLAFMDLTKDASPQSLATAREKWMEAINSNYLARVGLGDAYDLLDSTPLRGDVHLDSLSKFQFGLLDPFTMMFNQILYQSYKAYGQQKANAEDLQSRFRLQYAMAQGSTGEEAKELIEKIVELREQLISGVITENQYQSLTSDIISKRRKLLGKAISVQDFSGEELEEMDISQLQKTFEYQLGLINALNNEINALPGSQSAKLIAQQQLLKGSLETASSKWINALTSFISGYEGMFEFMDEETGEQSLIKIRLDALPTGGFNWQSVIDQVRQKVKNANLDLTVFIKFLDSLYDSLAELGYVEDTIEGRSSFHSYHVGKQKIDRQTAANYWDKHIAGKDNRWTRNWTKEKYVATLANEKYQNGQNWVVQVGNESVSLSNEANIIRGWSVADQLNAPKPDKNNPNKGGAGTDQSPYASNYSRDVARPTQVVFNIGSVASFDKTTVASSAEEQDLVASMEEKIANSVYQMFAIAANQAMSSQSWA